MHSVLRGDAFAKVNACPSPERAYDENSATLDVKGLNAILICVYLCNPHNKSVFIFKNNKPKYVLVDIEKSPLIDMSYDEKIDFVAARILKKYKPAFMELAK